MILPVEGAIARKDVLSTNVDTRPWQFKEVKTPGRAGGQVKSDTKKENLFEC